MKRIIALIAAFALLAVAPPLATAEKGAAQGKILSAFFGLDDSWQIRLRTFLPCGGVNGRDGMPVIFSKEINDGTLDPKDFRITTASGRIGRVDCVTLRPADEVGEKRTVLVIGEYGARDDQPVKVEITGELRSLDGEVNFKGTTSGVIPLEAGPTMILAHALPAEEWRLGAQGGCPGAGGKSIVRVTWTGGITKPGGAEIDEKERRLYRVTVRKGNGQLAEVTPIAVADLGDNDNNHELCIGVDGRPVSVFFPAGALTDPREDLNPDTKVKVTFGRS